MTDFTRLKPERTIEIYANSLRPFDLNVCYSIFRDSIWDDFIFPTKAFSNVTQELFRIPELWAAVPEGWNPNCLPWSLAEKLEISIDDYVESNELYSKEDESRMYKIFNCAADFSAQDVFHTDDGYLVYSTFIPQNEVHTRINIKKTPQNQVYLNASWPIEKDRRINCSEDLYNLLNFLVKSLDLNDLRVRMETVDRKYHSGLEGTIIKRIDGIHDIWLFIDWISYFSNNILSIIGEKGCNRLFDLCERVTRTPTGVFIRLVPVFDELNPEHLELRKKANECIDYRYGTTPTPPITQKSPPPQPVPVVIQDGKIANSELYFSKILPGGGDFNPSPILDFWSLPDDHIFPAGDYAIPLRLDIVRQSQQLFSNMSDIPVVYYLDGNGRWAKLNAHWYARLGVSKTMPEMGMLQFRVLATADTGTPPTKQLLASLIINGRGITLTRDVATIKPNTEAAVTELAEAALRRNTNRPNNIGFGGIVGMPILHSLECIPPEGTRFVFSSFEAGPSEAVLLADEIIGIIG